MMTNKIGHVVGSLSFYICHHHPILGGGPAACLGASTITLHVDRNWENTYCLGVLVLSEHRACSISLSYRARHIFHASWLSEAYPSTTLFSVADPLRA